MSILQELREQRWDDHRFYHHSRVNQTLHLISALSFLSAYALLAISPIAAAVLGWVVAMWSRQIGHFFFEPKTYDEVNHATHAHKEDIKVGYNLRRKVILMALWAASFFALQINPTMFGMFTPHSTAGEYLNNLGILWLLIGIGALLGRTVQLFFIRDVQTGVVWALKILTDPFHDVKLYYRAPLALLRGEWIDPMDDVREKQSSQ